jgi:hypothetical protein
MGSLPPRNPGQEWLRVEVNVESYLTDAFWVGYTPTQNGKSIVLWTEKLRVYELTFATVIHVHKDLLND